MPSVIMQSLIKVGQVAICRMSLSRMSRRQMSSRFLIVFEDQLEKGSKVLLIVSHQLDQGNLTKGEGSVRMTSSLRRLLRKKRDT